MPDLFGWDLVYNVSERSISKKEDTLTLLVHFLLIKNGFKCLGLGDTKSPGENENGSELLPNGWSDSNCYAIRYTCDKQSFVLRGVPVNHSTVFNLLDTESLAVSNVALVAEDEVKEQKGSLNTLFSQPERLMKKITDGLIRPVKERSSNNCEATTQTPQPTSSEPRPSPYPDPVPDLVIPHRSDTSVGNPMRDPLRVGTSDLDPLGGLGGFHDGGGMLFNPFDNRQQPPDLSGLPRGSVPPGARFDPFAPPGAAPGAPRRPPRGPPDFDLLDPFGGSGRRPFGGGPGGPPPPMFM